MKNVKAYVRTTLTAGLILAAAVLGGCSKSDAGSSAADTAAASSGTESECRCHTRWNSRIYSGRRMHI